MKDMKHAILGTLVASSLLAPRLASAVIIDNFDQGSIRLLADQSDSSRTSSIQDASILGGERDVKVQWSSASSAGTAVTAKVDYGNSNLLAHSQEAGAYGRTTITWDGLDASDALAFGLAQDFVAASVTGFNFDLISADLNGVLSLTVYTDPTHWSTVTYNFPSDVTPPGQHLFFQTTSFSKGLLAAGQVDWTRVNAIVLTIDGWNQQAMDIRIDQFDTTDHTNIPEPVASSLVGIGLAALALKRSRRSI